ncbi:hypothetical protein L4C31_01345 [Aliivibrio sifiae]
MFRRNNIPFVGVCLFFACQVQAANMYGTLSGTSAPIWNSAVPVPELHGGIAPSYWDINEPRATSEWYPGSLYDGEATTIKFIDPETGKSFVTDIKWKGVQYNMGSAARLFHETKSSNVGSGIVATSCDVSKVNIPLSTVSQIGGLCASGNGFSTTGARVTPFQFYRPIVELPNLSTNIQGLPSGRYTAFVQYRPVYFYKSGSGVMTYTVESESLFISIDYTAAFFTDATKSGDGVIVPEYDKVNKKISGKTHYAIEVTGMFPDGVKMTFLDPGSDGYKMHSGTSILPYGITCTVGCEKRTIVDNDGNIDSSIIDREVITKTKIIEEGRINIGLDVGYNVDADKVTSGTYEGMFNVKFEANL